MLPDQIRPVLSSIFNSLLNRPEASPIEFDRAHRALRPRTPDNTPPRECLPNYTLKEEILQKARASDQIIFTEIDVQLFQDFSPITLKNRRTLKPLLEILKSKGISYRWKFPFALQATFNGKQYLLRIPDDLQQFCENLQISPVELPDWYAEFLLPSAFIHQPLLQDPSPSKSPYQVGKHRKNFYKGNQASPAAKSSRVRESR